MSIITEHGSFSALLQRERTVIEASWRALGAILDAANAETRLNTMVSQVMALLQVEWSHLFIVEGNVVIRRGWCRASSRFGVPVGAFTVGQEAPWLRKPYLVHERLDAYGVTPRFAKDEGIQAWVSIPLRLPALTRDQPAEWLGALLLGSRCYEALPVDKAQMLRTLAEPLALAIEHARACAQARHWVRRRHALDALGSSAGQNGGPHSSLPADNLDPRAGQA
jgi:GAF domain-containing protein